jgi:hypothetical protein
MNRGFAILSSSSSLLLGVGGFAVGCALGGVAVASAHAHTTAATRYGSLWHRIQHWRRNWSGRVEYVRAAVLNSDDQTAATAPCYTNVFGLVCEECGYVNVAQVLGPDARVESEVCGRTAAGFAWVDGAFTSKQQ